MTIHPRPTLTVVIPAYNEEGSIGQTIERCLQARQEICEVGQVAQLEIVVVSDGSTDRTAEIASQYASVHSHVSLIVWEKNRGYGAAIKRGFAEGRGELVGFLDADGTCDPVVFGSLCRAVQEGRGAIAIGSRMGPGSQMPIVRRIGNRFFAFLLGLLSGAAVTDTASGMRVIRRDVLVDIYPLPDGLDFTPSMSARALMQRIPIVEVPMSYAERVGESKLRVVRDGIRFLRVITDAVLCYRPLRLLILGFLICLLPATLLAIGPAELYLTHGYLHEWMIYRFIMCLLLGTLGYSFLCSAALMEALLLASPRRKWRSFGEQVIHRAMSAKPLLVTAMVAFLVAVALVWRGVTEFVTTGHVTIHWSRVIVAAFGVMVSIQSVLTSAMLRFLQLCQHSRLLDDGNFTHRAEHELSTARREQRSGATPETLPSGDANDPLLAARS